MNNKFGLERWEGYTLEELRTQRTVVNTRIMVERTRLADDVDSLRLKIAGSARPTTILGRMLAGLSYLDWVVMAFTLFRRLAPLFRRR